MSILTIGMTQNGARHATKKESKWPDTINAFFWKELIKEALLVTILKSLLAGE